MYSTLEPDQPISGRRRQYEEYEPEAPEPAQSNDVTLGIPALLGIFFAIVVVCGLAFGFGYSFGHQGPRHATASAIQASPTTPQQPVGTAAGPEISGAAKPSALAAPGPEEPAPAPETPAANASSLASPGPPTMVQIAAVMHAADAEALASALRHDGYSAVVRTEPGDRFLHVQVGPFPTREAARAMRARLQANGYSPILKP